MHTGGVGATATDTTTADTASGGVEAGGGSLTLTPAAAAACQQTVFSGLAVDCNLNSGGSYDACCARLAIAEDGSCFCDEGIVDTVRAVIGEEGLDFFRAFAEQQCGAALTEGVDACRAKGGGAARPLNTPATTTHYASVKKRLKIEAK